LTKYNLNFKYKTNPTKKGNKMQNIKDRLYGNDQATLYLDDQPIRSDDQNRLADFREKFITSVYKLLKSDEFKDLYIKQDEEIDLNIHIKKDALEIAY